MVTVAARIFQDPCGLELCELTVADNGIGFDEIVHRQQGRHVFLRGGKYQCNCLILQARNSMGKSSFVFLQLYFSNGRWLFRVSPFEVLKPEKVTHKESDQLQSVKKQRTLNVV